MRSSSRLSTAASAVSMRGCKLRLAAPCARRRATAGRGSKRDMETARRSARRWRRASPASTTCSLASRAALSAAGSATSARSSATSRHISPPAEHKRVEAVVFRAAAHHDQEAGFQRGSCVARGRSRRRRRVRAACRGTRRLVPRPCRRDPVGLLVDHAKAHVLEHRHAFRQRDRTVVAPDLEPDAALSSSAAAVEVGAERALRPTDLRSPGYR